MFRFLISLLILWAITYGIFSLLNPLGQLSKNLETKQDKYTKLLTEAIERNNPDAKNLWEVFSNKKSSENIWENVAWENAWNTTDQEKNISQGANQEFLHPYAYTRKLPSEERPVANTQQYLQNNMQLRSPKSLQKQTGGIFFDPPLTPPPIATNLWKMSLGKFTPIRDFNNL